MDHGGYERKGEEMNCNGQFQDKKGGGTVISTRCCTLPNGLSL